MTDETESSYANEDELEVIQPSLKANLDAEGTKRKAESIEEWLATHSLSEFCSTMQAFGITEVSHLQDVNTEGDAQSEFGMSRFQARRLLRAFQEWKSQQEKAIKRRPVDSSTHDAGSSFKSNNKSVVVTLPPAFQGYFGTRDGGKSIIVNCAMLKKKWTSLW
ncbi:---NA--- [Paramuricea clavata]|uniref:---NA n=1 Tax=Paramuricea clavata TaxID=317549 RepID=A0A7D9I5E5_PARCT|nr:---NA--- [Paramuricea clavata]